MKQSNSIERWIPYSSLNLRISNSLETPGNLHQGRDHNVVGCVNRHFAASSVRQHSSYPSPLRILNRLKIAQCSHTLAVDLSW